MNHSLLILGTALFAQQSQQAPADLVVGENVEREITDDASVVHTPTLDANYTKASTVGVEFRVRVEVSGLYHVDLRSYDFDAYLIFRDANGELIAEDDDALISTHSRVVVELEQSAEYRLIACALHGARGSFSMKLAPGVPAPFSSQEKVRFNLEEARARLVRVESNLGSDHPDTATSLNSLAELLVSSGAYEEAKALFERALSIREEQLGSDHPETARSLDNLAKLHKSMGAYAEAEPLFKRALAIWEEQLGPDHLATAMGLGNLGNLLRSMAEYEEAKPLLGRALAIYEKRLGPEHLSTSTGLANLAMLHRLMGAYGEARPLLERALAIKEKHLGPDHPDVSRALNNLAIALYSMGAYQEAKPLFERALAINEESLGPDHLETANALNSLAVILKVMGESEGLRPLLERALAIRERALGPDHPTTAASVNSMAVFHKSVGEYEEARPLFERALAVRERQLGPDHPKVAASLEGLALLLTTMGAYEEAKPHFERALAIREKVLGPSHPDTAMSLDRLADLLHSMGAYEEARPLFERGLAIREEQLGPNHPLTAASQDNLARLLSSMGAYGEAKPLFESALAISEKQLSTENLEVAAGLNNLAHLLTSMGSYEEAKPLFERALAIQEKVQGRDHPSTATQMDNLANLLCAMEAYEQAKPLMERALAIREKGLGPDHPSTATSLNNLGTLRDLMGARGEAKLLYERALSIREKSLGADHPETAESLNNLATVLESMGVYEEAEPLYARAVAIWEKQLGLDHPQTVLGLNKQVGLFLNFRQWDKALEVGLRNQVESRGALTKVLTARTRLETSRYLSTLFWQQELNLSIPRFLHTSQAELGAAEGLISWKGQVGRAESAVRRVSSSSEETAEISNRLRLLNAELSRLAFDSTGSADSRERRLDVVRAQITELELKLRDAVQPDELDEFDVNALRELLPGNAAIVSFFIHSIQMPSRYEEDGVFVNGYWTQPHLVAWIIRPTADVVSVDLGLADEVKARTESFLRTQIVRAGRGVLDGSRGVNLESSDEYGASADDLRELIWDPLAPHLGDASLVVISHDQFTATLPFEVLRGEDGRYLVEDRSFAYMHDLQAIGGFEDEPKNEFATLFCVGGVDFDARENRKELELLAMAETRGGVRGEDDAPSQRWQTWRGLKSTVAEATTIRDLHKAFVKGGTQSYASGTEATEERVIDEMPRASIVHLATHGYFQPEGLPSMWAAAREETDRQRELGGTQTRSGLLESDRKLTGYLPEVLSGLVFAGANLEREEGRLDGYLTAADVDWMDLSGVELVTLSACETGLGRSESGEGMSGFRTTLLRAGAKTVVSSLWQVPDDSTEKLMSRFYENLLRHKMGKLEALREAQLWMLRENRRKYDGDGRPYSWGAFVLSGDWR